jgi:hypothetical protein
VGSNNGGGKMRLVKRTWFFFILSVVILLGAAVPALGLWGDGYHEIIPSSVSGWRGVAGYTYCYDWIVAPSGRHVSSLLVWHKEVNPYNDDGYNDGATHNWIHLECGLDRRPGLPPVQFWQYNRTAEELGDWYQFFYLGPALNTWSNEIKIGNVSTVDSAWQTWHINYNGVTQLPISMPMITGEAICSSEVVYKNVDDNRALFNNLRRKNSKGSWVDWGNSAPWYDGDPYYHYVKYSQSYLGHFHY